MIGGICLQKEVSGIYLVSDFRDYYDHAFGTEGLLFSRLSRGKSSRRILLGFLENLGLNVPPFGPSREVVPNFLKNVVGEPLLEKYSKRLECIFTFVVYTDELAHKGEGKIQVTGGVALEKYPDYLCVPFYPTVQGKGSWSLRYLQIGSRKWWLRYSSAEDWRSNWGPGQQIEILGEESVGYHPKIHFPLFAVDFILVGKLWAIDFNEAPGLSWTGMENILSPYEVVGLIENFYLDGQGS